MQKKEEKKSYVVESSDCLSQARAAGSYPDQQH